MNEQAAAKATDTFIESMETGEVVLLYRDMVYSIALTHTRRRIDADDVFQEVFLVYHRKRPVFPSEERRKAWLITTTLNCARQQTGSSWSKKVVPLYGLEPSASFTGGGVDDFQFASDQQVLVFEAMRKLPSIYRTVLHLFYFEDMSVASIAQALQLEPGTVRVQLSRARAQMKRLLEGANFNE